MVSFSFNVSVSGVEDDVEHVGEDVGVSIFSKILIKFDDSSFTGSSFFSRTLFSFNNIGSSSVVGMIVVVVRRLSVFLTTVVLFNRSNILFKLSSFCFLFSSLSEKDLKNLSKTLG